MSFNKTGLSEEEYKRMTPKVAKEYFEWFKKNISNELIALQDAVGSAIILDYSPESLIPLGEWFISERKYVELTKEQIIKENANTPDHLKDYMIQQALRSRFAPTTQTVELGAKVGIYLGEVFVRNDSDLYWDYVKKPKSDVSFNVPVIYGFEPPNVKPTAYLSVLSIGRPFYSSSINGEKEKRTIFEWYQLWMENKQLYYSPDCTDEKIMQHIMERVGKDKREGNFKEGTITIIPEAKIEITDDIKKIISEQE